MHSLLQLSSFAWRMSNFCRRQHCCLLRAECYRVAAPRWAVGLLGQEVVGHRHEEPRGRPRPASLRPASPVLDDGENAFDTT
jgi:hypothetical protein